MRIVEEKKRIDQDPSLTPAQRQAAIQALNLDGCPVVDLGLDFTLPGSSTVELRKGGKDQPVNIYNLEQYLKVMLFPPRSLLFPSLRMCVIMRST
jgi:E3 ubiquitin-protein ligase TRIP12